MSANLNYEQTQAVNCLTGPCLVLAGAGSGKTRVITHKIAALLDSGLDAANIAAITFTNKAAAEMRTRTRKLIGKAAAQLFIGTFHSLGVKILRHHGQLIGLGDKFSILSAEDVLMLLKDIATTSDINTVKLWQWQISCWKNNSLEPLQAIAQAKSEQQRQIAVIYQRLQERLTAYQSVDFDDLIQLPLVILKNHLSARQYWQQQLRYILVDEYQDTNAAQYELLKYLVAERQNFTVVGDDDQSIYGWRGATLENLRRLPQDFTKLKIIKLEQNYRSTTAILQAANNVIGHNPKLFPKKIWSDLGSGEPIQVVSCDGEEHEAERSVFYLQQLHQRQAKWSDCAVLYRANHQAKHLEKMLRKANIPYRISGGQSIFERAEIKDLCAWLRLLVNPLDDLAFIRAITSPKRGIGHRTLQVLGEYAKQHKLSLFDAVHSARLDGYISQKTTRDGLKTFVWQLEQLREQSENISEQAPAHQFFKQWLEELNYQHHLFSLADNEHLALKRWENVVEFCDWISSRLVVKDGEDSAASATLFEAIQTVSLFSMLNEKEEQQDRVTLSTLHAAKGLEWKHVILVGVNEELLPFKRDQEQEEEKMAAHIAEERRLMYVGITRAQRSLRVSWLTKRKKARNIVAAKPSRFIAEMQLGGTDRTYSKEKLQEIRAKLRAKAQQPIN